MAANDTRSPDTIRGPQGRASSTLAQEEPLIFEQSWPGRRGFDMPPLEVPEVDPASVLPPAMLRSRPAELPEVSEPQVVRHFVRMSHWNYAIDLGMYPLGSCTMKYNPRVNEAAARLPGFARLHPWMPEPFVQGALELLEDLESYLCAISGLHACSLQPAAGAQGELAGLLVMRAWQVARGEGHRKRVLVPDSAHGTNPASATLAGCETLEIPSDARGLMDPARVAEHMDDSVLGLMVTNPNTLGLFEERIAEVCEIVHARGGLVYLDGANMNAIQGIVRPGDMGVDVMHFNLHKTYSTPHGGGGPGAGPICVRQDLAPFLPVPRIGRRDDGSRFLDFDQPQSIGKIKGFWGNFGVLVRAWAYIRSLGPDGVRRNAELAVLNANYIRHGLEDLFSLAHARTCMHEAVFSDASLPKEVKTLDVCKRLMDYGYHPPTMYFPLNVHGALMIEPTESETRESLDHFIEAMRAIFAEARETPEVLTSAPHGTFRRRLDETRANRQPVLRWRAGDHADGAAR